MHFDGSKQEQGSGAGVVLTSPKGDKLSYVLQIHFDCSNNVAEYETLLHGLRMAKEMNIKCIKCYGDSDLVAQQVSGTWDRKDATMAAYRREVDRVAGFFSGYQVDHIDRRKMMLQMLCQDSAHVESRFHLMFSWTSYGLHQSSLRTWKNWRVRKTRIRSW